VTPPRSGVKVRGPIRLVFSIAGMLRGRDRIERFFATITALAQRREKRRIFSSDA
jgi:hypothetical protein